MKKTPSISLTRSLLGKARHVRAFLNRGEEEYRVLLPFINEVRERRAGRATPPSTAR